MLHTRLEQSRMPMCAWCQARHRTESGLSLIEQQFVKRKVAAFHAKVGECEFSEFSKVWQVNLRNGKFEVDMGVAGYTR